MSDRPKPPEGCASWLEYAIGGCGEPRDYARAELAEMRDVVRAAIEWSASPTTKPQLEEVERKLCRAVAKYLNEPDYTNEAYT